MKPTGVRRRAPSAGIPALIALPIILALLPIVRPWRLLPDAPPAAAAELSFDRLPATWDEGLPLGNGVLGALIWKKGEALRMSLDRADLWDLRPVREFEGPEFRFAWVRDHVLRGDYDPVHRMGDAPYDRDPAPTKIPAAALEFDVAALGPVAEARLETGGAVAVVRWSGGATMRALVHAVEPVGWFVFDGVPDGFAPRLLPPAYVNPAAAGGAANDVITGKTLASLGYPAPEVENAPGAVRYRQAGWGGMSYDVAVEWRTSRPGTVVGAWSVGSRYPDETVSRPDARASVAAAWGRSEDGDARSHAEWWKEFWGRSSISIPDAAIERQWRLDTYKFGSASRRGAPPITLQAVWTADDGNLPPWKGDYHNDLNTQLSYWPAYSGNRLEEAAAFTDWLWSIKPEAERYTRTFWGVAGLNVPGVATWRGAPMGGWIQYSLGPTVSAWLAHHFYLQWVFEGDRGFLEDRAYPWVAAVAEFLDAVAVRGSDGRRALPLSSSPEIRDNRVDAWFRETTNFDLALIRWLYGAAAEMAEALGRPADAAGWRKTLAEWPDLALAADDRRLLVAPGIPLAESHRHFSHLMALHPLGLVDWNRGGAERETFAASLAELDRLGPAYWCGYSYAWLANMAAWARDGEKAAKALQIFGRCFCLPNSFHANGDQCRAGYSTMTYRPFTLEGNFAAAAAVQEMLLQSHDGTIRVFPAVPASWADASFETLRARGAFLVSARRRGGRTVEVRILAEKGGDLRLENPFAGDFAEDSPTGASRLRRAGDRLEAGLRPGDILLLRSL